MANTERRKKYVDQNGGMFMPMNVEGGIWSEHFINTPKLICIVVMLLALFFDIVYISSNHLNIFGAIIMLIIWFVPSFYVTRYIIFEEKFYYKMYKKLQQLPYGEIISPGEFWNIASIKDTDDGAILTFSDTRIGAIVRFERDTITGKPTAFRETHYDAISDFYKELWTRKLSYVYLNTMEQAGKDPRLDNLSKLVYKSDNPNIQKLMELEVGHIKNKTRQSLYENDSFLLYTNDISRVDNLLNDITECAIKMLDGAYIGYRIMSKVELVDLNKEISHVEYFNPTTASLEMYDRQNSKMINPFDISAILWDDKYKQDIEQKDIFKIEQLTDKFMDGSLNNDNHTIKQTLYRKIEKRNNKGIKFSSLGVTSVNNGSNRKNTKATTQTTKKSNSNYNSTTLQNKDEQYIDF